MMPPSSLCQLYVHLMVVSIPLREAGHTEELSLDQISLDQIMVQWGIKQRSVILNQCVLAFTSLLDKLVSYRFS